MEATHSARAFCLTAATLCLLSAMFRRTATTRRLGVIPRHAADGLGATVAAKDNNRLDMALSSEEVTMTGGPDV